MTQFSIVMPIIKSSYILNDPNPPPAANDNFDRFFRVGLPSLVKFIKWSDVAKFFIIVRQNEMAEMRQRMQECEINRFVEIFSEDDLLSVNGMDACGVQKDKYRVQMICKLLIAKHVKTKHYLVIDDDIVALRPFGYANLFVDKNKTLLRYTHDDVPHDDWWRGSASVLGMEWNQCAAAIKKTKICVTPEVLPTQEVIRLLYAIDLSTVMTVAGRWTEYTLIWLFLIREGRLANVYKRGRLPFSDSSTNIWITPKNLRLSLRKLLQNRKQWFGVIQSNVLEHSIDAVVAGCAGYGVID